MICNNGIKDTDEKAIVKTVIDTKFGERIYIEYHHLGCRKEIESADKTE